MLAMAQQCSPMRDNRELIRGVGRGRLCFGRAEPIVAVQLPTETLEGLWSPLQADSDGGGREASLEHVFQARRIRSLADSLDRAVPSSAYSRPSHADGPAPTCVICLDDCDGDGSGSGLAGGDPSLKCSKCSMQAHARCLSRWFTAGGRKRGDTSLQPSYAQCPGCRTSLDWDALVFQMRRGGNAPPAPPAEVSDAPHVW
jgi:hypothetical protein